MDKINKELLFSPIKIGNLELKNRIIMAPLTRSRASEANYRDRVPNDLMKEYYTQRVSAGLIISEATSISPMGIGYANTPGIWSDEQIKGWKKITDSVQDKGGKMMLQLWHVGRISHPDFLYGELPVAPSSIQPHGHVNLLRPKKSFVQPRELETREVYNIIESYKKASINAKKAGFDGVEIHAANGYLIDQFIQSSTNKRQDAFGGDHTKRAQFLLQIVDAISEVWPPGNIGVHLAPACDSHSMGDENPKQTFGYIAKELSKKEVAFLFLREPFSDNYLTPYLKNLFNGPIIANQDLTIERAHALLNHNHADAVSFGRHFISNPDLVAKLKNKSLLRPFDTKTFYTDGKEGYIDY